MGTPVLGQFECSRAPNSADRWSSLWATTLATVLEVGGRFSQ